MTWNHWEPKPFSSKPRQLKLDNVISTSEKHHNRPRTDNLHGYGCVGHSERSLDHSERLRRFNLETRIFCQIPTALPTLTLSEEALKEDRNHLDWLPSELRNWLIICRNHQPSFFFCFHRTSLWNTGFLIEYRPNFKSPAVYHLLKWDKTAYLNWPIFKTQRLIQWNTGTTAQLLICEISRENISEEATDGVQGRLTQKVQSRHADYFKLKTIKAWQTQKVFYLLLNWLKIIQIQSLNQKDS